MPVLLVPNLFFQRVGKTTGQRSSQPTQFGLAGVGYQVKYFFANKQTNKIKSLEFLKHTFRKNQNNIKAQV